MMMMLCTVEAKFQIASNHNPIHAGSSTYEFARILNIDIIEPKIRSSDRFLKSYQ